MWAYRLARGSPEGAHDAVFASSEKKERPGHIAVSAGSRCCLQVRAQLQEKPGKNSLRAVAGRQAKAELLDAKVDGLVYLGLDQHAHLDPVACAEVGIPRLCKPSLEVLEGRSGLVFAA